MTAMHHVVAEMTRATDTTAGVIGHEIERESDQET